MVDDEKRSISQICTGVGLRSPGSTNSSERVSRVFLTPDTRGCPPSTDSRRTRAFHVGYVPPVPSLPDTDSTYVDDSDTASYRQDRVKVH